MGHKGWHLEGPHTVKTLYASPDQRSIFIPTLLGYRQSGPKPCDVLSTHKTYRRQT